MNDDDQVDELDDVDELASAPAVCHFCGAETRDGLMVWPDHPIAEPYWPICWPCMGAALSGGVRYARSPN